MRRATSYFFSILVIAVAAAGAAIALWSRDDILDGSGFVETTAPVVERADVREAVADLTVSSLGTQPPQVQAQIRSGARELAGSERFAALWREANGAAHAQARALIKGDRERVVLDVGALADLVVVRLRAAGADVGPEDVDRSQTRVVVLDASEAEGARDVASWTERLALVLPAVVGGGLVALLLLARRRDVTIAALSAACAITMAAAAIALGDAEQRVTEAAPSGPDGVIERAYARAVTQPLRTDLRRGLWLGLAVGCLSGAAAVQRLRR